MSQTSNLEKPQEPLDPQETPLVVVNRRIVGFYTGLLQAAPQDATDPWKPLVGTAPGPSILTPRPQKPSDLVRTGPRTSQPSEGPLDGPDIRPRPPPTVLDGQGRYQSPRHPSRRSDAPRSARRVPERPATPLRPPKPF
ncbi:hypothetical protein PGTUg99_003402 [Puccinia graminis f. sp. tritici]|uniref:Uncharacterized protein n=1 Tax=Puccinia graminis f. sp. tritici TaxID=56615 RepID=A0A5B0M0T4_PUCGR|nr:hypothetical protein PGTUg99_003402 [Puccinia graminis f. sp. tritici]